MLYGVGTFYKTHLCYFLCTNSRLTFVIETITPRLIVTVYVVTAFLQQQGIVKFEQPTNSLYCNPIKRIAACTNWIDNPRIIWMSCDWLCWINGIRVHNVYWSAWVDGWQPLSEIVEGVSNMKSFLRDQMHTVNCMHKTSMIGLN